MTTPGGFQRTAFQTDAFQVNQALSGSLSMSGTAGAAFAPGDTVKPSVAFASQASMTSRPAAAIKVKLGSSSSGAFQASAFQPNAFMESNREFGTAAAVAFSPMDGRRGAITFSLGVGYAVAASGLTLHPTSLLSAQGRVAVSAHQAIYVPPYRAAYQGSAFQTGTFQTPPAQPDQPLLAAQARIDLASALVRGGGGKRKRLAHRPVEPEVVPPTFERFLKERRPPALRDIIAVDQIAPLLKDLLDVGWAKARSAVPTRPHDVGTRAPPALPTLRIDLSDLDDQLDAMAVIAGLPDPAVIQAQRLAAEAQDLHDIAGVLTHL